MKDTVQHFDPPISHCLGQVKDLKPQRSTSTPIFRLPPEILCGIFRDLRGNSCNWEYDDDRFWTETTYSEPTLHWIAVSHVCRQWRHVAINDARLWTDPPLKNPQWTMLMLERSRMATMPAITLKIDGLNKHVVNVLTPHISRISYLVLPRMERETLQQFLSGLPLESPRLEALSINTLVKFDSEGVTRYCIDSDTFSSVAATVTFPKHILRDTPKLRRLQLKGVIIDWTSPLLSHLNTLSLGSIPDSAKPTPDQFKTMLESAPSLRRLHLADVCPSPGIHSPNGLAAPILMQHLEFLTVQGTTKQVLFFMRILAAPALRGLTIHMPYDDNLAPAFPLLLSAMNQPYLPRIIGTGTDVRRLALGEYDGTLYIRASQILGSERYTKPDKRVVDDHSAHALTIWIDSGSEDDDIPMDEITDIVLPSLCSKLYWAGLSELDISDMGSIRSSTLASTFGALSRLRIVIADGYTAPWFTAAMDLTLDGEFRDSDSTRSPNSLSFPGLRHLFLGCTPCFPYDGDTRHLCNSIRNRYKSGIPLISVNLDWNCWRTNICSQLKPYVSHIVINPSIYNEDVIDDYSPYTDNHDWYL